jgi:hypothetical protein
MSIGDDNVDGELHTRIQVRHRCATLKPGGACFRVNSGIWGLFPSTDIASVCDVDVQCRKSYLDFSSAAGPGCGLVDDIFERFQVIEYASSLSRQVKRSVCIGLQTTHHSFNLKSRLRRTLTKTTNRIRS